jgi:hypothetical protein
MSPANRYAEGVPNLFFSVVFRVWECVSKEFAGKMINVASLW